MIIVTTEVALTSTQPLHGTDNPDFLQLVADYLFDISNSDPEDVFSDYKEMTLTVSITSDNDNFEVAVSQSLEAVEAALGAATAQMPWVEAKISSVQAKELTAA